MQPVMEAKLTSGHHTRHHIMNLTQPTLGSKMKQPHQRVTSQPNMFAVAHEDKQMRTMGQNTNTMSGVPGPHMLNNFSSGTTHRMHQTVLNQKLPIISTRKAHFAID